MNRKVLALFFSWVISSVAFAQESRDRSNCFLLENREKVCMDETVRVEAREHQVPCEKSSAQDSELTIGAPTARLLTDMQIKALCAEPISASSLERWDRLSGPTHQKTLTTTQAEILLLRFGKPGGFDPEKDLDALVSILKSDLVKTHLVEMSRALQGVLNVSPITYSRMIEDFPKIADLSVSSSLSLAPKAPNQECRSQSEREILLKKVANFIGNHRYADFFKSVSNVAPLRDLLRDLPKDQWEWYADSLAQRMTDLFLIELGSQRKDWISSERSYVGSMESKIYHFIYQRVAQLLGKEAPTITDLTYVRLPDRIVPLIFASSEIKNLNQAARIQDSRLGFHYAILPRVEVSQTHKKNPEIADLNVQWQMDGKQYEARLKANQVDKKPVVVSDKSPDYASTRKDGVLTGMIVVGSNLGRAIPVHVQEYKNYLEGKGFKFESRPQSLEDVKSFIQSKVENGEMDFWLKEDHQMGNIDSLMLMRKSGRVETGVRQNSKGIVTEKTYLVYTDPNQQIQNQIIRNQELSSWFKKRKELGSKTSGQLLLINSSCSSAASTARQIEAVQDKDFLPIPTIGLTSGVFGIGSDHGKSPLLEGVLSGKSYDWMRKEMGAIENRHKSDIEYGDFDFNFIFPSEKEFKSHVLESIKYPINVDLTLMEDGKPYSYLTVN